jgi:hypothetical protein
MNNVNKPPKMYIIYGWHKSDTFFIYLNVRNWLMWIITFEMPNYRDNLVISFSYIKGNIKEYEK